MGLKLLQRLRRNLNAFFGSQVLYYHSVCITVKKEITIFIKQRILWTFQDVLTSTKTIIGRGRRWAKPAYPSPSSWPQFGQEDKNSTMECFNHDLWCPLCSILLLAQCPNIFSPDKECIHPLKAMLVMFKFTLARLWSKISKGEYICGKENENKWVSLKGLYFLPDGKYSGGRLGLQVRVLVPLISRVCSKTEAMAWKLLLQDNVISRWRRRRLLCSNTSGR